MIYVVVLVLCFYFLLIFVFLFYCLFLCFFFPLLVHFYQWDGFNERTQQTILIEIHEKFSTYACFMRNNRKILLPLILAIFTKGNNLRDFLFDSSGNESLPIWDFLWKERICTKGVILFSSSVRWLHIIKVPKALKWQILWKLDKNLNSYRLFFICSL